MNKENQCQSFTLRNAQCKNKCVDNFCRVHDPKECEKREKVRRLYREIEERSYKYLKYVEREVKKSRIRHRRWVERLEKKKENASVQCKALTKKGLSCQIATKSDYCHVHKHLVTNFNEIKTETDAVMFKYPDDFDSLMKELIDQFYKVQPRSYIGPEIDINKIEKINNLYIEEKELVIDVYDSFVSVIANCSNFDNLGNIDDFRNRITVSVNEVYEKTDASILSVTLDSASPLENDITISFREELRGKCYELVPRSYNGPKLDSDNMKKVNDIYLSELKRKLNIYGRIINNIVNEPNVKLSISDIASIKGEIEESLVTLHNKSDEAIKSIKKANNRSKRSKNYGKSSSPYHDIASLVSELEDEKSKIQLRSYNGPELDHNTQRRVDKFYRDEVNIKISNLDGIAKSISSRDPLEDIEEIQDLIKESKRTIKATEKSTDAQVNNFTAAVLTEKKPLSDYY
jgi:hypothetical protein